MLYAKTNMTIGGKLSILSFLYSFRYSHIK